jgi:hypothetical protein
MSRRPRQRFVLLLAAGLLILPASTSAQIIPTKGRLEYSADADKWPTLEIRAANGSPAYVLSLNVSQYEYLARDASGRPVGVEILLRRPQAKQGSANLAEPRIWHGVQPFLFDANDFADGIAKSVYGSRRTIDIERRKLRVVLTVAEVEVQPPESPELKKRDEDTFSKIVLDVEVDNAQ